MANILVVGAGMAGLSAALQLKADGHTVTIYEALPRLGGRAFSTNIDLGNGDTTPFDWGAEAIEATADAQVWEIDDPAKINKTRQTPRDAEDSIYSAPEISISIIPFQPGQQVRTLDVEEDGSVSTSANTRDVEDRFNATLNDDYFDNVDLLLGQTTDEDISQRLANFFFFPVISDAAEVHPPLGSIHNQVRSHLENEGYESAHYNIDQDLGGKVALWATGKGLDKLCKFNQSVLYAENVKAGSNAGKVMVRVRDVQKKRSREEYFEAVLVTVPTDRVRGASEREATQVTDIYLPDLSELDLAPFRANPLACYYKLAITGLDSVKDLRTNAAKLQQPQAGNVEFITFESGYSAVTLGRSEDGKVVYLHAAGDTGRVMSDNPDLAANALVHAVRQLNPTITDLEINSCKISGYDWNQIPFIGGAYSANHPGLWMSRELLQTFRAGNIYYAGEACSTRWFGQLAGAFQSGETTAVRMHADLS